MRRLSIRVGALLVFLGILYWILLLPHEDSSNTTDNNTDDPHQATHPNIPPLEDGGGVDAMIHTNGRPGTNIASPEGSHHAAKHQPTPHGGWLTGGCPRFSKRFAAQFHLNAYLIQKRESVEVQIFNAFGALLDERCRRYASALTAPKAGPLGFFADIGGNDGADVVFWLKRFGGCDSPCGCGTLPNASLNGQPPSSPSHQGLHFVVFEPQSQYQARLAGMAIMRQVAVKRGEGDAAAVRQSPLTVVQAAVGKSSQHDTQLVMVGGGEQAVVKLEEHKDVNVRENNHVRSPVKIKSLAKVLEEISPLASTPILALKVDAEGADAAILMASSPLFTAGNIDFVIFELNKNVKFFDSNYAQATNMLREAGYRTFLVGVSKAGEVTGMLTYIALEVDGSIFRKLRVSLETMIAVSPSMASLMMERSSSSSNLFGAVGIKGRQLNSSNTLVSRISSGCYYNAFAWEGVHQSH